MDQVKRLRMLHGADYNPEQWSGYPDILAQDIVLMKEAGINCVSVGIFSWARLELREGVYDMDWLADIVDRLYENGIDTILATPSGAKPLWLSERYEEVRRVAPLTGRDRSGGRHNHCYTSPVYREKVRRINAALAKRFSKHPGVILWHISNEYGGTCYCPKCQAAFRSWLQARYGTLDALNHAWWTAFWSHTYTDWQQIHAPVPNGETGTHGLNLDWKRFTTDQVTDFMRAEISAVQAENPDLPVTTNLMYDFYEYDYSVLAQYIDIVSWDSYPMWHEEDNVSEAANFAFWHDYMRCLKGQPFLLMESTPSTTNWRPFSKLKKPGMHMTSCIQAIAHGSNSIQYFQFRKSRGASEKFHGAVVDHDGSGDTRVFRDVAAVGRRLRDLDGVCDAMPCAEVALIYDVQNRWAVEDAAGPRNSGIHYIEALRDHYRAFWDMGVNVDVVDSTCELRNYRLVVAPMMYMLRAGVARQLTDYVAAGGTLVFTYHSGIVDGSDLTLLGGWPGDGLMDVFGLWNEEIDSLCDGETNGLVWNGRTYPVSELCTILHARGSEVLGTYASDFYAGTPALTVNRYGKGCAYYIAARPEAEFLRDFYGMLAANLNMGAALDAPPPEGVEAVVRSTPDTSYLFLQNYREFPQSVSLPDGYRDIDTGAVADAVTLPAFGQAIFRLAAAGVPPVSGRSSRVRETESVWSSNGRAAGAGPE